MKLVPSPRPPGLSLVLTFALLFPPQAGAEEWSLYGQSSRRPLRQAAPADWYALNKIMPVPAAEASADHYIDEESMGTSPIAASNIIRVWEKTVFKNESKPYEATRADVEKEEEQRLGRGLTVLDMARIFPLAVNRATKEIRTLYEINCESREFVILEVDLFDVEGGRIIRETNPNLDIWYPVSPGTLMEVLYAKTCGRSPV